MLDWGWDQEYGGILYYRDVKNLPILATNQSFRLSASMRNMMASKPMYQYFPDREYGEWYGYLERDFCFKGLLEDLP